ncbi:MAG: insulinase family protein, partial [Melioribacteraceae bacterium]|nr:insulinase family protein [Melioribacteraceae bacterium]
KDLTLPTMVTTIVQHPLVEMRTEKLNGETNVELYENNKNGAVVISKESAGSELLAIHYLIKNKAMMEHKYGKDAAKTWHDAFGKRMDSPDVQKFSSKFGFTFTVNDNPYIPMDNIYLSPEFGYIRVEGLADSVEAAIKFLNDQFLNFIPTESEFQESKASSMMPSMMGHGNKTKMIFDSKLNSLLYENDEYGMEKPELTYETLLEFGKEYFIPSNMIISVVSPTDNELIEKYFAGFEKEGSSNDGSGRIEEFKAINKPEKIDMEGGGEQSYLYFGFQKKIEESEKASLTVLSLILSDNISFDIREKQGLAYRMSAGIDLKKDRSMFYINMGTRPENVDKLIPQFPTFFTKDFSKIITDELVKKAVNIYLGRMMFRRLSSINQAYYLGYSKYFYDDINHDQKSLDALKMVDASAVLEMIDKYMVVENPIEVYVR